MVAYATRKEDVIGPGFVPWGLILTGALHPTNISHFRGSNTWLLHIDTRDICMACPSGDEWKHVSFQSEELKRDPAKPKALAFGFLDANLESRADMAPIFCLPILGRRRKLALHADRIPVKAECLSGLIIQQSLEFPGAYRRLGMWDSYEEEMNGLGQEYSNWKGYERFFLNDTPWIMLL